MKKNKKKNKKNNKKKINNQNINIKKQNKDLNEEKDKKQNKQKNIEENNDTQKVEESNKELNKNANEKNKDIESTKKIKFNLKEILTHVGIFLITIVFVFIIYKLKMIVEAVTTKTIIAFFISIYSFMLNIYLMFKVRKKDNIYTYIKIVFPVIITLYVSVINDNILYLICGLSEILLIYLVTNLLFNKFKKIANIFNGIFMFIYNFQVVLFILANNFLNLTMLQNLTSLDGISGNFSKYLISFVLVCVASFIPSKKVDISKKLNIKLLCFNIITIIYITITVAKYYSPYRNLRVLYDSIVDHKKDMEMFEKLNEKEEEFYKDKIEDFYMKPDTLTEKPNVIVFFTEGLSQHIIDDNRDFMPNIKKYQDMSLNFTTYFNHTFATYRGIIGQLYSGYQYNNNDVNKLVSIQSILQEEGYKTEFLNTEPNNVEFRSYINNLGFMKNYNEWEILNGKNKSVADKDAYEKVFEKAIEYNNNDETFFLTCYTYGTHVTFDGVYYKETNNNIINKFTELDNTFGEFIEKFKNSPLYDNTIIVFTADHATYSDSDFKETFPDRLEIKFINQIDAMPLFIYHKDVEAKEIDVDGRTTIDFAPTVLDYLDISKPNYFLGESLFSGKDGGTRFDISHFDSSALIITDGGVLTDISLHSDKDLKNDILRYIALYKTIDIKK